MDHQTDGSTPISSAPSGADFVKRVDVQGMIDRLQGFTQDAPGTWASIKGQSETVRSMYEKYIVAMVVVPALCGFVGNLLSGVGFGFGLKMLIITSIAGLGGYYLGMLIAQNISPRFGGTSNESELLKWLTFAALPNAAAGVLQILTFIPLVSFVVWLVSVAAAIFSLYLLWLGIPIMVEVPNEKRVPFLATLIAISIVVGIVVFGILGLVAAV